MIRQAMQATDKFWDHSGKIPTQTSLSYATAMTDANPPVQLEIEVLQRELAIFGGNM